MHAAQRKGRDQLLNMLNDVKNVFKFTDLHTFLKVIIPSFESGIDTIDHTILLQRLDDSFGVNGKAGLNLI